MEIYDSTKKNKGVWVLALYYIKIKPWFSNEYGDLVVLVWFMKKCYI